MTPETAPAYGLWLLAFVNAAVFIMFALSFSKPQTPRDWRSFGAFSAFLVALFAEMYGFPLTIYLLSGWLGSTYPGIDWFSHDAGHLPEMMFGWRGSPHFGPFPVLSYLLLGALRGAARRAAGHDRALRADPASAVCGLRADPDRVPGAMADDPDAGDVSGAGLDVPPLVPQRGGRGPRPVWRRI